MNPDLSLVIAGLFAEFAVRITLAFGVCLILSRLITAASLRFTLWSAFLYGSAAYWVYLAATLLSENRSATGAAIALNQAAHVALRTWSIPQSWAFSLGISLEVVGVAYGLTLGYSLISHANKMRSLRWVMRFACEAPAEITEPFQALAKAIGMRPPRLLMLSGVPSPATFGWLGPVVVLPALCAEQDPSHLEDILLHELHHVRRRDSLWNALGIAARALICFHPAAWYAMKTMRFDRELACDGMVVSRCPERRGLYAESLLHFARLHLKQEPATWGIDFAASSEHLTVRVHSILTETRKPAPCMFWLRAASGLSLLAVFAGLAPSLGVLLRYTHPLGPQTQPAVALSAVHASRSVHATRRRSALPSPAAQVIDTGVAAPAIATETETVEEERSLPSGPGPHLQHRPASGASGNGGTTPRSIALIDESDSGQTGAHSDKGQTVQQSATVAAAIWKRVGDLDRH